MAGPWDEVCEVCGETLGPFDDECEICGGPDPIDDDWDVDWNDLHEEKE